MPIATTKKSIQMHTLENNINKSRQNSIKMSKLSTEDRKKKNRLVKRIEVNTKQNTTQ